MHAGLGVLPKTFVQGKTSVQCLGVAQDPESASSNHYNNERASKDIEARQHKVGGNMLSQIHHNGALQIGKTIALSLAEIKIERTLCKNSRRGVFP